MNEQPAPLALRFLGAAHGVATRLEAALEPIGLSLAKFRVLSQLVAAGEPLPLRTIADYSSCVRSNVTQLVDRLEADKLVERMDDPKDRRSVRAAITAEGRRKHTAAVKALSEAQNAWLSGLSESDRSALVRVVGSLQGQW